MSIKKLREAERLGTFSLLDISLKCIQKVLASPGHDNDDFAFISQLIDSVSNFILYFDTEYFSELARFSRHCSCFICFRD